MLNQLLFEKDESFRKTFPLETRKKIFESIQQKFKSKVVIAIIQPAPGSKLKKLEKKKYVINTNLTINDLYLSIKNKILLSEKESFFLTVESGKQKIMCTLNQKMFDLYEKYKNAEDGFLYMQYHEVSTFGSLSNIQS